MMGLPRTLLAALLLLVAGPVFAQVTYPTKQVRMVVPFPAGGSATSCAVSSARNWARRGTSR
jgi:tripartite-type tricarboxylate transporter receptor subunit TctC